ncbi:molybdopterin-synthase adenylyltransferase MoeB [Gemmatimonas groenlandica]|uniref:Molybdopterin-synthase adenylyltransferase n=1 Tax=Gemmatimonas groenlandica TaxID=2732249 RepID=A0A6M4IUJ6_9BACT|nr:molybdopterin-synthase adenylyltransferase MoeB [Gemmatimonas groenlandica]QJR37845.1 molybdopterin-synthase adenylyltransferase MoeB [Gemmatimonas groenlandica]
MDGQDHGHAGAHSALPPLSTDELNRYSRHLTLPGVGLEGQQRLKAARVLIVGAGGLGSPTALYLAAAGVGTLGLVDQDEVDVTNLQRQLLHGTRDVGRPKLESARDRLLDVNPHVQLELHATWLTSENALELLGRYDVIIDGTDNFNTRYLVNDACVLLGKPNVHGSVFQFDGQASVFATEHGPCYRCLYPEPPPPGMVQNCAEGGVLGVLPGLIGTIQATEALKLILQTGETLAGRLLMIDALAMQFRSVTITRDPQCPACGTRTLTQLVDYDEFCGVAGPATATALAAVTEITPAALALRHARGDDFDVIDVREPHEAAQSRIAWSRLIPLGSLPGALETLDRTRDVVVICRSGKRSADAARLLQAAGFSGVTSLAGGMLRWARDSEGEGAAS